MPLTLYKVRIYFRLESTEFGRCFKTWERQTEKNRREGNNGRRANKSRFGSIIGKWTLNAMFYFINY